VIAFHQRATAIGMNRSGKSELIRFLFVNVNVRRVLVDPKGEWLVPGRPRHELRARDKVSAEREVDAIDWSAPIVHVKPGWLEKVQLEALFDRVASLAGGLTVWVDECYGVSSASWCPRGLNQLVVAGAGLGHGVFAATQRPRNIATVFKTEADHVFLFPPIGEEDMREARSGVPFLSTKEALELAATTPQYGYIWASKRDKRVAKGPPIPPEYLSYRTDVVRKR
jgi:hypothetical protein